MLWSLIVMWRAKDQWISARRKPQLRVFALMVSSSPSQSRQCDVSPLPSTGLLQQDPYLTPSGHSANQHGVHQIVCVERPYGSMSAMPFQHNGRVDETSSYLGTARVCPLSSDGGLWGGLVWYRIQRLHKTQGTLSRRKTG